VAVVLAIFRDRNRLGTSYCVETAGAWTLLFAAAGIKQLIVPDSLDLWQLAAGVLALYGCVLLVSAGRPAMLTAPYHKEARTRLSEQELHHAGRMGWLLTGIVAVGAVSFAITSG
jgi:hypothetical protein